MVYDPSKIESLVEEVRPSILAVLSAMEADGYLIANVEKGEGNRVVIIVGLRPITPSFPRGINIPDKLDELYSLIKQAVLEKAKTYGVEVQPVRANW